MNQQKTGAFLRELRKEKGLTQEQFAEIVLVSGRTVSRWENGRNLPDIDVLIEISDFYGVDLRELLDGERKSEKMNKEQEETILKTADYMNTETERYNKKVHRFLVAGALLWFISQVILHTELIEISVISAFNDFAEGAAYGMLIAGIIVTSRYGQRLKAFKQRLLKRQ